MMKRFCSKFRNGISKKSVVERTAEGREKSATIPGDAICEVASLTTTTSSLQQPSVFSIPQRGQSVPVDAPISKESSLSMQ